MEKRMRRVLRPGFDKDCNGVGEPVATAPETPEADGGEDV